MQSISLINKEARSCWINTTVGVLGVSASAATTVLTKATEKGMQIGQVS